MGVRGNAADFHPSARGILMLALAPGRTARSGCFGRGQGAQPRHLVWCDAGRADKHMPVHCLENQGKERLSLATVRTPVHMHAFCASCDGRPDAAPSGGLWCLVSPRQQHVQTWLPCFWTHQIPVSFRSWLVVYHCFHLLGLLLPDRQHSVDCKSGHKGADSVEEHSV